MAAFRGVDENGVPIVARLPGLRPVTVKTGMLLEALIRMRLLFTSRTSSRNL